MSDSKEAYRTAVKGTAIFGGVQFILALTSVIRAKFVAILIGVEGMGILALFTSSINLINQISGLGISYSGVRDIAKINSEKNTILLAKIIIILNRLIWVTGLLGGIFALIFSRQLSIWAFDSKEYTISFMWLAIAVIFNTITLGLNSLLQGMRMLRNLAKSSVLGAVIGLIINIPLYYFWGIKGIVPSIIISSVTTFLLAYYYSHKIEIYPINVTFQETLIKSKQIIKLGLALVFTGLISTLVAYLMNLFLQDTGGREVVGLYQAGWGITTQYVGLIFTAMGTDFFPRLSMERGNYQKYGMLVNQQIQIAQLIITPLAITLILFANLAVYLLLSKEFYPIIPFIQFTLLGMLFKSTSWAMAFIILSEGNTMLFLGTEVIGNSLLLILNLIGYNLFGLVGIGYAFICFYVLYFGAIFLLVKYKYQFSLKKYTLKLFAIQQFFLFFSLILVLLITNKYLFYFLSIAIVITSVLYSFYQLDRLISIREFIINRFWKHGREA